MMFSSTADRSGAPARGGASAISRLELAFEAAPDGRTYIASQYADYPFHVCRPHYLDPELPGMASLYLQSCAGGLFENDNLVSRVTVRQDARSTSPARPRRSCIARGAAGRRNMQP